ncbi:hypothetical protein ACFWG5_10710 [Streptomyces hydrogenans]|uniref:hypothetical protein n=2 Tax=Streptomyces hydrogenans TaxID=1873719 RepID=UPI00364D59E7
MRELYACQLGLNGGDGSVEKTLERADALVREWIARPSGIPSDQLHQREAQTASGHTVRTSHFPLEEDADPAGMRYIWEFPGSDDASMRWTLDIALAAQEADVCTTVRIGVQQGGREFQLSRPIYQFGAPAIVRTLLREFHVSDAGQHVAPEYRAIRVGDISEFIDFLTNQQRALPVVAVTNYPTTGRPLVDLKELARELAGLAHVVVVSTHLASQALTEILGPSRSVWQGAVRLYWPQFTTDANPYEHKLWTPNRLLSSGESLVGELRRWLGSVGAASVPENPTIEWIRTARRKAIADSSELPAWVEEYLKGIEADRLRYKSERDDARRAEAEAKARLEGMREQYAVVAQYSKPSVGNDSLPTETEETDISSLSVYAAYERAKAQIGDDLVLLPGVDKSIKDFATYRDSEKLHRALLDVAEAGRRWSTDTLGKPFGEYFRELGYGYSALNPAAQARQTRRHYEVKYKNGTVLLEAHLKVDEATSPDQCLRIYWYIDQHERVLVVGHVGRHLPD